MFDRKSWEDDMKYGSAFEIDSLPILNGTAGKLSLISVFK